MRGVKFGEFEKNKVLRYAVERQLRLIGDVAFQVSPRFRSIYSEIDWNRLTEFRHMIEHQYGETLTKHTWIAAAEGLLERLLSNKT